MKTKINCVNNEKLKSGTHQAIRADLQQQQQNWDVSATVSEAVKPAEPRRSEESEVDGKQTSSDAITACAQHSDRIGNQAVFSRTPYCVN